MSSKYECPATASKSRFGLNLVMIVLGAVGLYFLSIWIAALYVVFFLVYFFVIMPVKACRYCYYRSGDITLEEWKEKYLDLHANCMKMWGVGIFVIWGAPIVGILISFYTNFSIVALLCLIGFVILLFVSNRHLRESICSQCAMLEVCPIRRSSKQ